MRRGEGGGGVQGHEKNVKSEVYPYINKGVHIYIFIFG